MNELTTLQTQINKLETIVSVLSSKIDFLNPALFLEFKGAIVETLKTFDKDIDDLKNDLDKHIEHDRAMHEALATRFKEVGDDMLTVKVKMAIYSALIAAGISFLASVVGPYIFK